MRKKTSSKNGADAGISIVMVCVLLGGWFLLSSDTPQSSFNTTTSDAVATSQPQKEIATTTARVASHTNLSNQNVSAHLGTSSGQPQYGVRTKTGGCTADQTLPDPACSPGAVLTTDTNVICVSGYTQTVRNVPDSEKQQVFAEYGIPWSLHSGYEVDHIISLELGGSNDISNLFPESYSIQYNAHVKDTFENYLHSQVCKGNISITAAQQEISTDWLKYYLAWKGGVSIPTPPPSAAVSNTAVATPAQTDSAAPAYYTSSHYSSRFYYPASCSAWKGLSPAYLVSYPSLEALLARYPDKTLSPQCP